MLAAAVVAVERDLCGSQRPRPRWLQKAERDGSMTGSMERTIQMKARTPVEAPDGSKDHGKSCEKTDSQRRNEEASRWPLWASTL